MKLKDAVNLIEDIITCANKASNSNTANRYLASSYIQAYQELTNYLKYLFVYYNKKVSDDEIKSLKEWGWYKLFKKLNESPDCDKVTIVTYNYDIWLERILANADINFEVLGVSNGKYNPNEAYKFNIIKPHGSISFAYRKPIDASAFQITSKTRELTNGNLSDYTVNYDGLENVYMFNAMIPPAGDSSRIESSWAYELRKLALEEAKSLNYGDEFLLCGISYWHVDRQEIDELLISINPEINVKMINPNPPTTLSAVLTSLFDNHITYKNSSVLGEMY
ncbi:hypothetical protein PB1_12254 [Bacillus methanolicus PB1]|uniref:SIR2-like domain-containing protein n=1 Tax=Bacillus methanolicus PB1 TaxID=997296 RepID=I3DVR0_BACMT|nr:hypothetical protein [Bacillus methanolicus]EIJ78331.1 hypothetical protein PB1_12254 [Bacillus methanolicus PB1]